MVDHCEPGEDIIVMTSGAFAAAYLSLSETFSKASGHRFITATTKMGVGNTSIPSRLAAGETVDIVIVASSALEKFMGEGSVVRGTRVDLAQSCIAMAVREGEPIPDVGSIEAFKQTLLSARSVACSTSVSGQYLLKELFPKLGIANELQAKTRMVEGESVGTVVARGDAEIGFQQMSELNSMPGIAIAGPLPEEVQQVTVFSAGIASSARHSKTARTFLAFLTSPEARQAIEETGLESIHAR